MTWIETVRGSITTILDKLENTKGDFDHMSTDAKLYIQEKVAAVKKNYHESAADLSDDERKEAKHEIQALEQRLREKGYKAARNINDKAN